MENDIGFIYILENEALHGMCKIGRAKDVNERLECLNGTNIPFRFKCVFECKVRNYIKVEKAIHKILDKYRVQKDREFFYVEPWQVIPLLELLQIEAATENISKNRRNNPKFDLKKMGIKDGERITFVKDGREAEVIGNTAKYHGKAYNSLASLTNEILKKEFNYKARVSPTPHWKYKGKTLEERWDEYLTKHKGD